MTPHRSHSPASGITRKLGRVLLVHDETAQREALFATLTESRFLVQIASSAGEGLAHALARPPDVVVADLDLGGETTCLELAERLMAAPETSHVGRIALTARTEPGPAIVRAFDAYLRQPIDARRLADLVRQLTDVARAARTRIAR